MSDALQQPDCFLVAVIRRVQQGGEATKAELGGLLQQCILRCVELPAAAVAASAGPSLQINGEMSKLPREAGGSLIQLLVQNNACADSDSNTDINLMGNSAPGPVALLPFGSSVGFIINDNRQVIAFLEQLSKADLIPFQVRCEQDIARIIDDSGNPHANSHDTIRAFRCACN